jgi:hypothetical protein
VGAASAREVGLMTTTAKAADANAMFRAVSEKCGGVFVFGTPLSTKVNIHVHVDGKIIDMSSDTLTGALEMAMQCPGDTDHGND